jgi:hypothetical protein
MTTNLAGCIGDDSEEKDQQLDGTQKRKADPEAYLAGAVGDQIEHLFGNKKI